jgi:hypothetical protein
MHFSAAGFDAIYHQNYAENHHHPDVRPAGSEKNIYFFIKILLCEWNLSKKQAKYSQKQHTL